LTRPHVTVDAYGRRKEIPPNASASSGTDHVDVDQRTVPHDVAFGPLAVL
ncbi:MAG: hypothetical protein H7Y01_09580, partial [Ferruginibacter sp.]|nr:hypothetical protein [Chitinophagaceae bacterium]